MAKKYNMDKVLSGKSPFDEPAFNKNPSREELAKAGDLFAERGTERDDGKLNAMLGIEDKKEKVIMISLGDTRPFGGEYGKHRFRMNDEKIEELAESIRQVGILNPLIVRKDPDEIVKYEVIAGMTRRAAAIVAGEERVPAILRDCDDEEAELIMVASNHQREDLLPTEKGWMYRIEYEAMKRQGERSDLTSDQDGQKLEKKYSIDELAEKSDDSRNQIQRFIRLTYLIEPLAALTDDKKIPLVAAVDLSYLSDREQDLVHSVIFADGIKINAEMAAACKAMSQNEHELTITDVHNICKDIAESAIKPDKKYSVPEILFPEEVKKKERADYVIRALRYIRENRIEV